MVNYCPNCGRSIVRDQRYCKSCGLNLTPLNLALSGELVPAEHAKESRRLLEETRRGVRTMFIGVGLAIFFFFFFHRVSFAAIGAIVFFLGLGRVASARFLGPWRQGVEWRARGEDRPSQLSAPDTSIPRPLEPQPPSVTEHTTVRLEQPHQGHPEGKQQSVE